jgi:hypothetical protein
LEDMTKIIMSNTRMSETVYCKYFEKTLCLRDNTENCRRYPYYKLVDRSTKNQRKEELKPLRAKDGHLVDLTESIKQTANNKAIRSNREAD